MQGKRIVEKNIYESIRKCFKQLPYISKDFPHEAERSAMALIHLTKQLFIFYTSTDMEAIRGLLNQVQIFRRWSYPVGPMAADLTQFLHQECKNIGNGFRQKVREEIPQVDFLEKEKLDSENNESYFKPEFNENKQNFNNQSLNQGNQNQMFFFKNKIFKKHQLQKQTRAVPPPQNSARKKLKYYIKF
ncbi:hypothetical protein PPERSA_11840 [Pseudocohnilembus persalinus]|uniref:Uncharacterized protein n=1 Tax=Pseudocohnilembus persalinus TaxID=266149 RepID=A0A0V0QJW3_PSEPJ|nr:hypothetical protein PPERSA_11840 [Pseudocohnilembus persalinus]|eukprot:KRX02500.1 hypothetical protein PPERSA_11840 [Pseudocohnilembus persalinus]